jgi:hypothetical protein
MEIVGALNEVFDLNWAYVDVVDGKLLLRSKNLMKSESDLKMQIPIV